MDVQSAIGIVIVIAILFELPFSSVCYNRSYLYMYIASRILIRP